MPLDQHRRANRDNWDDRVPIHWDSPVYDTAGFIADPARLSDEVAFDALHVGPVAGKRLLPEHQRDLVPLMFSLTARRPV